MRSGSLSSRLRRLRRRWWALRIRQPPEEEGGDRAGGYVVAFANSSFGRPLRLDRLDGPRGVRFTSRKDEITAANAVVFHVPTLAWLPREKPPGQVWVAWSQESVVNYPELENPEFLRWFDLTMTYRPSSDVPIPYAGNFGGVDLPALFRAYDPPPDRELLASFISSGIDHSGRLRWQQEIGEHLSLGCYGRVGRNRTIEDDRGRASKHEVLRGFRFTLAFENSIAPDYVTEKFYDPLLVGSVPVYLGADNVAEFAPGDRCWISVADFSAPAELARYLRHLAENEAEYRAYQEWRTRPLRPAFLALFGLVRRHPFVRLGERLLAAADRIDRGSR